MNYDLFYIDVDLLPCNPEEKDDLSGMPFQCKIEQDGIAYTVLNDNLMRADYYYELANVGNEQRLRRVEMPSEKMDYNGDIRFYAKPYETAYVFKASFESGLLTNIKLIKRE
jgi:hypothetical protein